MGRAKPIATRIDALKAELGRAPGSSRSDAASKSGATSPAAEAPAPSAGHTEPPDRANDPSAQGGSSHENPSHENLSHDDLTSDAAEALERAGAAAEACVKAHPLAAAGACLFAGLVIGSIWRRRPR